MSDRDRGRERDRKPRGEKAGPASMQPITAAEPAPVEAIAAEAPARPPDRPAGPVSGHPKSLSKHLSKSILRSLLAAAIRDAPSVRLSRTHLFGDHTPAFMLRSATVKA